MSGNYFDAKYQEELMEVEEASMAHLMARRAHEYVKKDKEYRFAGFSFCVTSSNGGAKLFLLSDKKLILDEDVKVFTVLMETYRSILLPFFPELEKKEKKEEAKRRRQYQKSQRSYKGQPIIWKGAGFYQLSVPKEGPAVWTMVTNVPNMPGDNLVLLSIRDIGNF